MRKRAKMMTEILNLTKVSHKMMIEIDSIDATDLSDLMTCFSRTIQRRRQ
jgi:hypothetical protein